MTGFHRMMLQLTFGGPTASSLQGAVELARAMRLAVQCVFVEDADVFALAGQPYTGELRLPGQQWQAMNAARLAAESAGAALRARELLDRYCQQHGIVAAFSIHRGDPYGVLAGHARPGDLVVLQMSGLALAKQGLGAVKRLLANADAVMMQPPSAGVATGPVAVIARPASRTWRTAAGIAAAWQRPLVAITGEPELPALHASLLVLDNTDSEACAACVAFARSHATPVLLLGSHRDGGTAAADAPAPLDRPSAGGDR